MAKKSAFQQRLDAKFRAKRNAVTPNAAEPRRPEPTAEQLEAAGELHPSRYPDHPDPTKGQVHGGVCNRTACNNGRSTFWNIYTHGFYCRICGPSLNFSDSTICAPVDKKPTRAEMDDPEFRAAIKAEAAKWTNHRAYG